MPLKHDLALQNMLLSKQQRNPKLKMKTSLEVLNIKCPPQEPTKRRALSLQEMELDG
jgi:hypothetical protein